MKKTIGTIAGLIAIVVGLVLVMPRQNSPKTSAEQRIHVYCAAGLKPAVEKLAAQYEAEYGPVIELQYGGSGTLLSNLQTAKRGDLYISADSSYQEIAREKGLTDEVLPLAVQRPVIAVPEGNPQDIGSLEDLAREDLRVALANPDAASVGRQTQKLLTEAGLWDEVAEHVRRHGVFKPTVNDVANDVSLGAVDAGIVWGSTAHQFPNVEVVRVPELEKSAHAVEIAVLKSTEQPTAALRFARYLNSRVANPVFAEMGFEPIEGDLWEERPEITFFCGAVNRRAVEDVIKAFEDREGVRVNTVYNGCGILTAQMKTINQGEGDGAGFPDVYMACDRYYLENVKNWFQEDVDISDAAIVIAVPEGNPENIQGLADLTRPGMRVAVGQPEQCTIGALTRIMLEKEGQYDAVMANVVTQTASSALLVPSVTTQSVDAAIAYITDTRAEEAKIDAVRIDSPYSLAIQPFAIAQQSEYKHLGRRLFQKIADAEGAFTEAGFHFRLEDGQVPDHAQKLSQAPETQP